MTYFNLKKSDTENEDPWSDMFLLLVESIMLCKSNAYKTIIEQIEVRRMNKKTKWNNCTSAEVALINAPINFIDKMSHILMVKSKPLLQIRMHCAETHIYTKPARLSLQHSHKIYIYI